MGQDWDFFVSHTQADRAWAEWIAWVLEEQGYRVLIQAWDFVAGSNWISSMHAGTHDATRTIAVLSDVYLGSVYGGAEWQAAWAADPGGTERKLLTARVTGCDRPGLLAGTVGFDLFGLSEHAARARLLDRVTAAVSGRAKPTVPPAFPGTERLVLREPRFPGSVPGVWNVPPHNPHFTGRSTELEGLARGLGGGAVVTVESVRGMGGVGKTQLAVEYAHARAGEYEVVWWVAAEEPALIADQFAALAARLGVEPRGDPEALRDQVHEELRGTAGWLLVFDNADTADGIGPWLPRGPRPAGVPGHVIVTTRRSGFGSLGPVMDLDVIALQDAVRLLRTRVPDLDQAVGAAIASELGRLPLALEQAAAYMDRTGMPAAEYLQLLRDRAAELHARGRVAARTDTIATLWNMSLDQVAAEDPAAIQLLEICSYLAPEPTPLDLLTGHADLLPEPLSGVVVDAVAFNETIAVLADYSVAKRTSVGLQVHRLIQAATRARHDATQIPAQCKERLPVPGTKTEPGPGHLLRAALSLLRADAPGQVMDDPQSWPRWAVLLPHVLAAADHAEAAWAADKAMLGDASWLLDRAGTYLRVHARPAAARSLLERALAIAEAVDGPDHPAVASRLSNFAQVLRVLGRVEQARPLQERALAIDEAAYGPDHPKVATDLNYLALMLWDLGGAEQSRLLQERALAIDEAIYGPDHPKVAIRRSDLALI